MIIVSIAVVAVALSIYFSQGRSPASDPASGANTATVQGGDIVISKAELDDNAAFFSYQSGDVTMELLAFRAGDGSIRTAFNTCAVCYDSGLGYYVQEGDMLVCQNCGNRYPAERVGVDVGGCNPIPIFATDRIEDTDTITIPADFIEQYTGYFLRWEKP